MEQLKENLEAEKKRQHEEMIRRDNNGQEQAQANNIRTVTEDLPTIVSNAHNVQIDIKVPTFNNEIEKNPMEFLNQMEKFLKIKNVREERKNGHC